MFDLAWSELAIIGVVALVVVGPKDLPKLMRSAGQMAARARKVADEFRGQFNDAMREAELDDIRKAVDEIHGLNPKNMLKSELGKLTDPVREIERDIARDMATPTVTEGQAAVAGEAAPPELARIEDAPPQIDLPPPPVLDGAPHIPVADGHPPAKAGTPA